MQGARRPHKRERKPKGRRPPGIAWSARTRRVARELLGISRRRLARRQEETASPGAAPLLLSNEEEEGKCHRGGGAGAAGAGVLVTN